MSWTTSVIIDPGETHKWRFLGGNRQDDFTMLSLLPEPYFMSLRTSLPGQPNIWILTLLVKSLQQCTRLLKATELAQ